MADEDEIEDKKCYSCDEAVPLSSSNPYECVWLRVGNGVMWFCDFHCLKQFVDSAIKDLPN